MHPLSVRRPRRRRRRQRHAAAGVTDVKEQLPGACAAVKAVLCHSCCRGYSRISLCMLLSSGDSVDARLPAAARLLVSCHTRSPASLRWLAYRVLEADGNSKIHASHLVFQMILVVFSRESCLAGLACDAHTRASRDSRRGLLACSRRVSLRF